VCELLRRTPGPFTFFLFLSSYSIHAYRFHLSISIRLTEADYEVSVCPDQLPVVSKDGLVLRKFTLNKQPALG
jgi:hypothetical protein